MRYINTFLFLALFAFLSCAMRLSSENVQDEDFEKIQGVWISTSDTNSVLIFEGKRVIKTYQKEVVFECAYQLMENSCDTSYLDAYIKASFINLTCADDNLCFEITGLSDVLLAYRETSTGKLHSFKKSAKSPNNW